MEKLDINEPTKKLGLYREPNKKLILHEDIDYKLGYPKPPNEILKLSAGKVNTALLKIDFKHASWRLIIQSIVLWAGSPLIIPICILLSKLMRQDIDLFKYENWG